MRARPADRQLRHVLRVKRDIHQHGIGIVEDRPHVRDDALT
jgi:hypothetical protein